MRDYKGEQSSASQRLRALRERWSEPDRDKGHTWDYDGVPYEGQGDWMNYEHEMRHGLATFECKTFDQLVLLLSEKLKRKPNIIDLMGGAYFLREPANVDTLIGIRVHDKDQDFLAVFKGGKGYRSKLYEKLSEAPNRRVLEADILTNEGWKSIKQKNLAPADLLVCRPVGPFDNRRAKGSIYNQPEEYVGLYSSLFRRLLSLVNKKSGVIFTEIPDIYKDDEVKNFLEGIDLKERCRTEIFTVPDQDYSWGGLKRRYAVIRFGN